VIPVEEAQDRVRAAFAPVESQTVSIAQAVDRVLAQAVAAQLDQPPDAVSAMDGYAVRSADAVKGARLKVIGSAPAGHPFAGKVGVNEAVRLFTGSVVPQGADAIAIQEDVTRDGDVATLNEAATGRHIRVKGLDFKAGEILALAGRRLSPRDLSLLAAADVTQVAVRRRPRVAFAATGDELSMPGETRKPGGIVASSGYGLSALIARWGGEAVDLGILPDTEESVSSVATHAKDADLILTLGGASVGDHDLVQKALGPKGFALDFWKIAMRPGKPLIFGRLKGTPFLGLPGNPVSTLVCAYLFVRPAISAMLGEAATDGTITATLARDMKANDTRQDYIRAKLTVKNGESIADPFDIQDSSMLGILARADGLIIREPHAPAAKAGQRVTVMPL
jgi:molybdopterin molybdotransferase